MTRNLREQTPTVKECENRKALSAPSYMNPSSLGEKSKALILDFMHRTGFSQGHTLTW
jgi:hypothetical protein